MVVIGQKIVLLGKSVCTRAKWLYLGIIGCNLPKWIFGQSDCVRAKVVVFGQKWL